MSTPDQRKAVENPPQWAKNAAAELVEMHGIPKEQQATVARLIAWHAASVQNQKKKEK